MESEYFEIMDTGHDNYALIFMDFRNKNEEEILQIIEETNNMNVNSDSYFGEIICTYGAFATPQIRQLGKKLTQRSIDSGRYIGTTLYGANPFIQMVANFVNPKILFGKNKSDCIRIIQEMYEGKRPNHLP